MTGLVGETTAGSQFLLSILAAGPTILLASQLIIIITRAPIGQYMSHLHVKVHWLGTEPPLSQIAALTKKKKATSIRLFILAQCQYCCHFSFSDIHHS
ncbi:hypothetical protein XELAEV_18015800mg [Xenopus laevis]|uniref:Uncharacterized protein n=1 Tax=Xenopus laevis TaxID=8355 RepID=A0A974DIP5_XENLA|nr:hypothetical protein XELAEV_18015800mg [Xenopus laevis]